MTDPVAPQIPDSAPQEVKDFFSCKSNKLVWKPGEVSWITLKDPTGLTDIEASPSVTFDHGENGGTKLTISLFGLSGTADASINAAGELTVGNLSAALSPFNQSIQDAIKRINDWFKHNGKKLKPTKPKGGSVTLEKIPIGPATSPTPATAPIPPTAPKPADPPKPADKPKTEPVTPSQTQTTKDSKGGGCGLLGMFIVLLFVGVIVIGGGIGYTMFGEHPPAATPTAAAAAPTPGATNAPTPRTTQGPTPALTPTPTVKPTTTPTPAPTATPTVKPLPTFQNALSGFCAKVVHKQYGAFVSYLDWWMYWYGFDVDHFELTLQGANNDQPVTMAFDPTDGSWRAKIGLLQAGPKPVIGLIAILDDGTPVNVTPELVRLLAGDMLFNVRFPQEDSFGTICPN